MFCRRARETDWCVTYINARHGARPCEAAEPARVHSTQVYQINAAVRATGAQHTGISDQRGRKATGAQHTGISDQRGREGHGCTAHSYTRSTQSWGPRVHSTQLYQISVIVGATSAQHTAISDQRNRGGHECTVHRFVRSKRPSPLR